MVDVGFVDLRLRSMGLAEDYESSLLAGLRGWRHMRYGSISNKLGALRCVRVLRNWPTQCL
jgi:hypothetical protein